MSVNLNISLDFDDPTFRRDPQSVYRQMCQRGVLHWDPVQRTWMVMGYKIARRVLAREQLSSDILPLMQRVTFPAAMRKQSQPIIDTLAQWLLFQDGAAHQTTRRLLQPLLTREPLTYFSETVLDGLIRERCQWLETQLSTSAQKPRVVDLVSAFFLPLVFDALLHFLGIPNWPTSLAELQADILAMSDFVDVHYRTADHVEPALQAVTRLRTQMTRLFKAKQTSTTPMAMLTPPMITAASLAASSSSTVACSGGVLSYLVEQGVSIEHGVSLLMLLLAAGSFTTANALSGLCYQLFQHPEQLAIVAQDPERYARSAFWESVRYDPPIHSIFRVAKKTCVLTPEECALAHCTSASIEAGQAVRLIIAAINRDPEQHQAPDTFDVTRTGHHGMPFGAGAHHCLGQLFALMLGERLIPALIPILVRCDCPASYLLDPSYLDSSYLNQTPEAPLSSEGHPFPASTSEGRPCSVSPREEDPCLPSMRQGRSYSAATRQEYPCPPLDWRMGLQFRGLVSLPIWVRR